MIREGEIISILLALCVLVFFLGNRSRLKKIPRWELITGGFYFFVVYLILGVLEEFFLNALLNLLQHMFYAGSNTFLAVWCWKLFGKAEGRS